MVLGGDMTGKALVPVIHDGGGRWHATLLENRSELERRGRGRRVRAGGHPPRLLPVPHDNRRGGASSRDDEPRWHALFEEHMLKTVERWMALADEGSRQGHRVLRLPRQRRPARGRRRHPQREARRARRGRGRRVEAASRWPRPAGRTGPVGHLPRGGRARARRAHRGDRRPGHRARPSGRSSACTARRTARARRRPGADRGDGPQARGPFDGPAARRRCARRSRSLQPALSLHGHIHEARGSTRLGRTLCINPGSSYEQGQLLGAVVELDGKKKVKRFVLTSG